MELIIVTYFGPGIVRSDVIALSQKAKSFDSAALLHSIQMDEAKGFSVSTVTSDGEQSIVATKEVHLQNSRGARKNVLGRGSHAHHAESAIRHVTSKTHSLYST
jgi:hypothetical protein